MTDQSDSDLQALRREGGSLLRLTRELREFVQSGLAEKTFPQETEEFLGYVAKSFKDVEQYILDFIGRDIDPVIYQAKLRDFGTIKEAISWLYTFAKEGVDADSLSIPFSLATFLNKIIKGLPGLQDASLVFLASLDLNYYKCNLKPLRKLTNYLETRIEGYKKLADNIGILKFPYSAAQELLVNCILFHEMGHYIYENMNLGKNFQRHVEKNFLEFIKNHDQILRKASGSALAFKGLLNYVRTLLLRWTDEIFADIFAIRLAGPAFHFAALEVRQILPGASEQDRIFSMTHPANDFRFKQHAKWLSDGWYEVLEQHTPEVLKKLKKCQNLEVSVFEIGCNAPVARFGEQEQSSIERDIHKWMLEELESMISDIEDKINILFTNIERPFADFDETGQTVTKYLEHGIVPSIIYDEKGKKHYPNPVTMLNCGYFFYLGGMKNLLKKVKVNKDTSPIDTRLHYERRLSQWLGKGIEDWQILEEEQ